MALKPGPVSALFPAEIEADFIEVKTFTPTLSIPEPAAKRETVAENAPFPYLLPLPGAQTGSVDDGQRSALRHPQRRRAADDGHLRVSSQELRQRSGISNLQFVLEYRRR
jgi:hypothetical protein